MDLFKGDLYPTQEVFKYPKAGEENPKKTHLKPEKTRFLALFHTFYLKIWKI